MNFNASKCAVLRFSPTKTPTICSYFIHGSKLEVVSNHKYRGVLLSNDFKWSPHIDSIVKKACQQLGFVRRNTKDMPKKIREAAYQSLVRRFLEYCTTVWDPYTKKDIS